MTLSIGTPGVAWGPAERTQWRATQTKRRSHADDVLAALAHTRPHFDPLPYGELDYAPDGRYPLVALQSRGWRDDLPVALITGGVHGYETSGVQGALAFLRGGAVELSEQLNLVVAPCVSPWAYEVINRWNPAAIDPNRSFIPNSPAEESRALMAKLATLGVEFLVHMDLHETTDSDEHEFRPALAARDGKPFTPGSIPDGFYTVGDVENPQPEFQAAIIRGVAAVTHIAPADAEGNIIGVPITQPGVINYACKALGLCAGMTNARFTTTTEVYPDSPTVTPAICNAAQVAALRAGLGFALTGSS